ncbi:hypothetical protein F66182_2746 [Fusarium sp. NRRL 66182]|nr:hypothetical protein F66182_2746 [Fusarium sp. NRRL 66182]
MNEYHAFTRIEDWLNAVVPDLEFTQSLDPLSEPRLTPPPSKSSSRSQRGASPTKHQPFNPSDEHGGGTGDDADTAWTVEVGEEWPNPPPIPFRGFNATALTSSQPGSLVSGGSSQSLSAAQSEKSSLGGRRKKSPLKSANGLWVLDLPIVLIRMGDDPSQVLPGDVQDLFKNIDDIVTDHINIFPSEIRKDVEAIIPRARRKNDWFRPAESACQQQASQQETSFPRSRKPESPLDVALHELDFLRDIGKTAQDCQVYSRAEPSWNIQVHQPLLQHALAEHSTVQVEPSLTARILAPFSPITSGRGGGSVIENKMIDFCLTLWLNDGKPRQLLDENNTQTPLADAKLMSAIAERVWSQSSDAQSVNQTAYPPLQFAPIACNIETKTSGIQQDGELQLSVWTAAWYQRITMLLPERIAQYGIVTVPLLYIIGHDWKLSFASWRGDRIEIIGSLVLGDTRTLLGSYTVIAVLRKIGDWIATVYRAWIEKMFL